MGAMPKLFSSDHRDDAAYYTGQEWKPIPNTSTPDPKNFIVKRKQVVNGFPIFWVKYPGVTNYEGNKILMYPKHFNTDLLKERMDPHFFDRGDSPIARFEPTKYGWELAETLAENS